MRSRLKPHHRPCLHCSLVWSPHSHPLNACPLNACPWPSSDAMLPRVLHNTCRIVSLKHSRESQYSVVGGNCQMSFKCLRASVRGLCCRVPVPARRLRDGSHPHEAAGEGQSAAGTRRRRRASRGQSSPVLALRYKMTRIHPQSLDLGCWIQRAHPSQWHQQRRQAKTSAGSSLYSEVRCVSSLQCQTISEGVRLVMQVERWGWTASTRHLREQQYRTAINSYRRKHLCALGLHAHETPCHCRSHRCHASI